MKIPPTELHNAERKCNILAEIQEDFSHVVDGLEQTYRANIRVTVIRPVIGGGAGPERILLSETDEPET
ncbi:MAG: hypothetical protein JO108_01975 [Acidobacteriaceae bacterium]|nr:hypothetical protein [Acidobacteriaceae bacterium]